MAFTCPHCREAIAVIPGKRGRLTRCHRCGTQWMARPETENPYHRGEFRGRMEPAASGETGLIIEHSPAAPAPLPRKMPLKGLGQFAVGVALVIAAVLVVRGPIAGALAGNTVETVKVDNDALIFERVRSARSDGSGRSGVVVEGRLVNPTEAELALPAIEVVLVDDHGAVMRRWRLDLARTRIDAGEAIGFRTGSALPAAKASDVRLTLVPRLARPAGAS